jgi:hypothetical protein
VLLLLLSSLSPPCDKSVNQHEPQEQFVGSPEPARFHFGVGLLGYQHAIDQVGFTRAQVPLTSAGTITISAPARMLTIGAYASSLWRIALSETPPGSPQHDSGGRGVKRWIPLLLRCMPVFGGFSAAPCPSSAQVGGRDR